MPDQGDYEKIPRPESIQRLLKYLAGSRAVLDIRREHDQVIRVERAKYGPLIVFMTNIYTVSLSDVHEIISEAGELDAIVTMSAWNGYTSEAKQACKEMGIGLFQFKEFLGAVYYDGQEYLDYIPPEERKRREQHRKRD